MQVLFVLHLPVACGVAELVKLNVPLDVVAVEALFVKLNKDFDVLVVPANVADGATVLRVVLAVVTDLSKRSEYTEYNQYITIP